MTRENSFSDEDGRSLTPDLEDDRQGALPPASPTYGSAPPLPEPINTTAPITSPIASASKRSLHKPYSPLVKSAGMTPKERFRSVAKKVMAMHRSTMVISNRGVGAEPGVDPRRADADLQFGSIKQDCVIELFDYSAVRASYGRMTNAEFVNLMNDPRASEREPWVKVRWINIGGISWDVIKAVSIKYNLHPLALEDVFHTRSQTRSKADYFSTQLFLRILCHEIGEESTGVMTNAVAGSTLNIPRSSSPDPFTRGEEDAIEMKEANGFSTEDETVYGSMRSKQRSRASTARRRPILPTTNMPRPKTTHHQSYMSKLEQNADARQKRRLEEVALEELKKQDERVPVQVYPVHIFLLRDGTVISIHSSPENVLTRPIVSRIHQRDSVLRTSADPSLLVESLLDLIVDKALEVVDEFHAMIRKFEREVLMKPSVRTIRNLHILGGDLTMHKRTLEPIKTVIYGLRRYDLDRCAAVLDMTKTPNAQVVGFMSHKSKIYLADVYDHMDYALTSLEMFSGIGDNLVDYTFNMKSYEMNETMRLLTMVTIIFLPLTLLTGYFGMNFNFMWSVHNNSDLFFWILALPIMAIVAPLALFGDLRKMYHYFQKKVIAKNAVQTYQGGIKNLKNQKRS